MNGCVILYNGAFTRVKNSMIDIKDLMKCYDVVLINICVIRIISLCLLLCDVTQ